MRKHSVLPDPAPVVTMVFWGDWSLVDNRRQAWYWWTKGWNGAFMSKGGSMPASAGRKDRLSLGPGVFEQTGVGVFNIALEGLIRGFVPEGEGGLEAAEDLFADLLGDVGGEHCDLSISLRFLDGWLGFPPDQTAL
jgi:hypothetical protein